MRKIITVYLVVYTFVALAICYYANEKTKDLKVNRFDKFAKIAAVGMTFITSLVAATLTPLLTRRQQIDTENKARLREAYRKLYSAIMYYYRGLADLERGVYNSSLVEKAEVQMNKAESYMLDLLPGHPNDARLWEDCWQGARVIKESIETSFRNDPTTWPDVWKRNLPIFGRQIKEFRINAANVISE